MFEFGRLIRCRMQSYASPTLPQLETLQFVAEHSDRPTMRELAAYLKVKAPTATALVDELAKAKLIERLSGKTDRREVSLGLTAAGKTRLKEHLARKSKVLSEVLTPLSVRDRKEFNRLLEVIVSSNR